MRRSVHVAGASSIVIAAIMMSSAAYAQTDAGGGSGSGGLADIVVTAQRRSQSLNDVGLTISVADGDQLARQGITSVSDLAKVAPGFSVQTNHDGSPIYSLRGINFNSQSWGNSPTVAVSTDEAPIPFGIMSMGGLLDLERVEVLKGPQGTLYGQNATAGAVNLISAKPTSELHYGGQISYGRFSTVQAEGFVSGPLSEKVRARAAVGIINSGPWQYSWSRNPKADPTLYGGSQLTSPGNPDYVLDDKNGDQRKLMGRILIDWEPSDRLKVGLNLNGFIDRSDNAQPQLVSYRPSNAASLGVDPRILPPGVTPTTPYADFVTRNPAIPNPLVSAVNPRAAEWDPLFPTDRNNKYGMASLRADYELSDNVKLTSLTTYQHMDIVSYVNSSGYAIAIQNWRQSGNISAFNQEVRAAGDIGDNLHFIVGANYAHAKTYQVDHWYDFLNSAMKNANFFTFRGIIDQTDNTYAGFANLDWDITSNLTLSAGIRYTHTKHAATSCTYDVTGDAAATFTGAINFARSSLTPEERAAFPFAGIAQGGCFTIGPKEEGYLPYAARRSFTENNVPFRLNLNYKLNPDTSLYATFSRGFKAGAYPAHTAASYVTLAPVRQEELTSYEAGIKARLFDRRLSINAAAYYYDYKDKQLITYDTDFVVGLVSRNTNVPKSHVIGFDVDVTLRPIDILTLRSAVTYTDSKVDSNFADINIVLVPVNDKGNSFNNAPKWSSVSDAELRVPISDRAEAFLGGTVTYNSQAYSDLAHNDVTAIDPWTTIDLRAGVSFSSNLELMVWGRNITNEYYWSLADGQGDSVVRKANMPATYGATVRFKY